MPFYRTLTIAALTFGIAAFLSGCSWFARVTDTTPTPDTTQTPNEATASQTTNTSAKASNERPRGQELKRADFGFSVVYPSDSTYQVTTACFEGCPGVAVPAFIFSQGSATATLEVSGSEYRAVHYFGAGTDTLESFIKTPLAQNSSKRAIPGGTRYEFEINIPGSDMTGGIDTKTSYVAFVGDDAATFMLSAASNNSASLGLLAAMAASFEFI